MKLLNQLIIATVVSLAFACGNGSTNESEDEKLSENNLQTEGMKQIDLSEYELNATISVPDESKGEAEVVATDWGSIVISISDWYGIEIVPFGISIEEKKAELTADLVYSVEYLTEEENLIMYKKTIAESDVDPEFHFFMTTEINGELVEVKSAGDQTFTKKQVEAMINSAKTLSQKVDA
ncbi:MAG: hypothetical protein RJQ00_03745 [Vicingaceae bacterium]